MYCGYLFEYSDSDDIISKMRILYISFVEL